MGAKGSIGATDIHGLLVHLLKWLSNLRRASTARKMESRRALQQVIRLVRRTNVYLHAAGNGAISTAARAELAERWTELGFRLDELGLSKLARRCEIRGRLGADPDAYDDEFLERADIRLDRIETLARLTLRELESK